VSRLVGIVTTARSEYGIYRPLLRRLSQFAGLDFGLYVGGMHLSGKHGHTVDEIVADGWPILAHVEIPVDSETPETMARSMGLGTAAMASALSQRRPDILVVLGDRFEMHSAALAALPFSIPLAHIHGGELTLGAIDDTFRHSLTKLSHLHFPSTAAYARRIMQMGEEPWRVTVAGAPALDSFFTEEPLPLAEVERRLNLSLSQPPVLVTLHAETLGTTGARYMAEHLTASLAGISGPMIVTAPNADPGGREIAGILKRFVEQRPQAVYVESLGARAYRTVLSQARLMVGNSSSGLIEAASFALPVVNIGERQAGRVRPRNVIDVASQADAIRRGIARADSASFRAELAGMVNPYGDGHACERIVSVLGDIALDGRLLAKKFCDMEPVS
jgi:UDP-hydrolysing UDP-N-acetyl-D-glucosamine 2-epimerase